MCYYNGGTGYACKTVLSTSCEYLISVATSERLVVGYEFAFTLSVCRVSLCLLKFHAMPSDVSKGWMNHRTHEPIHNARSGLKGASTSYSSMSLPSLNSPVSLPSSTSTLPASSTRTKTPPTSRSRTCCDRTTSWRLQRARTLSACHTRPKHTPLQPLNPALLRYLEDLKRFGSKRVFAMPADQG